MSARAGHTKSNRDLRSDALAALQAYDWPGNVRQLRNLVDWLLIMAPGEARELIRAEMLVNEHVVEGILRLVPAARVGHPGQLAHVIRQGAKALLAQSQGGLGARGSVAHAGG